jgi:hypothetical protein
MSKKNNSGMWDYLESLGILEKGTDDEIKAAKKAYRKIYLLKYKQKQREKKPEFNVHFSNENGEFGRVESAAKKHNMPVTSFIRKAVLAYIENKYIVPNPLQVGKLEQVLSECLNEVQKIVKTKERFLFDREDKYKAIEKKIEKLETEIDAIFRHPQLVQ